MAITKKINIYLQQTPKDQQNVCMYFSEIGHNIS